MTSGDADREGDEGRDGTDADAASTANGADHTSDDDASPIAGPAFLKAAALASVSPDRLSDLLATVQRDLGPRIDDYRRQYERIATEPDREAFLVESDHWDAVADRLGLTDRERDAVARAHETAVERLGTASDRREEFETALEIRSGVVIGVDDESASET